MDMSNKKLRIVFLGTAAFGVPALEALIRSSHEVIGVVTSPDKPAGRGLHLSKSPVKLVAEQYHIPVWQPVKLKDPTFLADMQALRPDLQVVVAFRMMPEALWKLPPMGTINIHASLLPDYRGAAPIQWAVINGETETGITIFQLSHEIDTGDILAQSRVPILPGETAGELHDRLKIIGAELLVKTIDDMVNHRLQPIPQQQLIKPGMVLHPAPKIHKEDARIHWDRPAREIVQLILGMNPSPVAWTLLDGKMLRIFHAHVCLPLSKPELPPGTLDTDGKTYLHFAAADGWVAVDELQLEGRKRLPVREFLKGFRG
ncbi:methionyl-tRNA formyltransferase [Thermoflavifilum aggregans]|uniref:Methionyl-tRNA formyltransferase n=2 Tax=Thermoflavifilum aggregans TaxID=454188 RepID=A0A2M9CV54_9BACT|nr:methionyl-tRNA formyltransferase [Thermoflavifilum aggregans]